MAEIKNLIYKDLNFHLPEKHTVTDGEIAEEVERFRKQFSEEEITDENETLNVGDTAHMDFCGYVNGEKFEGGEAKCYDLKIGSRSFIDGFEDQMVGMAVAGVHAEVAHRFQGKAPRHQTFFGQTFNG